MRNKIPFEATEEINQALSNTASEKFAADPFWYDDVDHDMYRYSQ